MHPRPIAVFDFDHTLTSSDTFAGFCRWLLVRDAWRLAIVAIAFPLLGPLLVSRRTVWIPIRLTVWVATLGVDHDRLDALVREYVDSLAREAKLPLLREGLERLVAHREQGHDVVIATGALESLVRALLATSGHPNVPVVGSSLKRYRGGMVADRHCFGARKIPMLTERGYPPAWDFVYTDHEVDLPLLRHAKEGFLVNPKPRARRHVSRELAIAPTVLAWR